LGDRVRVRERDEGKQWGKELRWDGRCQKGGLGGIKSHV